MDDSLGGLLASLLYQPQQTSGLGMLQSSIGALSSPRPDALPPSVMDGFYLTRLDPLREAMFQNWVKKNNVPFDPSPMADYDMRGFYSALVNGDPRASNSINNVDNHLHYPDYWKTPYHQSFSNESKFSTPDAPRWQGNNLIDKNGRVVYSEDFNQLLRGRR